MCRTHSLRLLVQTTHGYVGRCEGCRHYNVAFKNIVFVFNEEEFLSFQQVLCEFIGGWCLTYPTSLGKEVGLKTPLSNLYLMFTHIEYEALQALIEQVHFWIQSRDNINNNLN